MIVKTEIHDCGGTVLWAGTPEPIRYCNRCRAFAYGDDNTPLPSGTDREANRRAFDEGAP